MSVQIQWGGSGEVASGAAELASRSLAWDNRVSPSTVGAALHWCDDVEVLHPRRVRNRTYYLAGLAILGMNLVRHKIRGYRTPRPQPPGNASAALHYDSAVANNWLRFLGDYVGGEPPLAGRRVLEIGPGPDLGTGLVLLARGAASYLAVDKHPLLGSESRLGHRALLEVLAAQSALDPERFTELRSLVDDHLGDPNGRLGYHHLPDFDLSVLPGHSVDLLVSHSVLEHLEDVAGTLAQLDHAVAPGCILVGEIDLRTHTRWIRDADPLNIYRYTAPLYRALRFSGTPNRVRPHEYVDLLAATGWTHARLYPRRLLDPAYVARVQPSLAPEFRRMDPGQLGWMSFVLCARREE